MLIWCLLLVMGSVSTMRYNYTCKFKLPDGEVYDLTMLGRARPPDYTYTDDEHLFVFNFCGPTFKLCAGIEGGFASIWNATTRSCLNTVGGNNPIAKYIDNRNKFKGVEIEYLHGRSVTKVEITCDQAYDTAALMKAERVVGGAIFHFKSKLVCRNYAIHKSEGWSGTTIFIILFIVGVLLYMCYSVYQNTKKGVYTSFSDPIPQKEFVMNMMLKGKELVNKVTGRIST